MPGANYADVLKSLELRSKALAANIADLDFLELSRGKLDTLLTEMKQITVLQASLTAAKQDASRRLAVLSREAQKLLTFVDAGVRQHYGNRSEKLVEFGQQPFRPQPRIRVVGLDGKPVKPGSTPAEPPTPAPPAPPPLE